MFFKKLDYYISLSLLTAGKDLPRFIGGKDRRRSRQSVLMPYFEQFAELWIMVLISNRIACYTRYNPTYFVIYP